MVPAIAVPIDDPRLDTLRDRPEISPWRFSGKADCTTLTEGVSMTPTPRPIRNSPGAKYQAPGWPFTWTSSTMMPMMVITNPAMISVRCWNRWTRRPAASEDSKMPTVAAVKITPVWIAL